MSKLEELQKKETDLRKRLSETLSEIRRENLKIIEQRHGVRIGVVVKNGQGFEYKVSYICTLWTDKPSLKGFKRNKSGEFSKMETQIYGGWEVVA